MTIHHLTDDEKLKLKRELLQLMASKTGLDGLLELIAELCSDNGDGGGLWGGQLQPDPFWLAASAQVSECKEQIDRLLQEYPDA